LPLARLLPALGAVRLTLPRGPPSAIKSR
jgi:hypothetical protein